MAVQIPLRVRNGLIVVAYDAVRARSMHLPIRTVADQRGSGSGEGREKRRQSTLRSEARPDRVEALLRRERLTRRTWAGRRVWSRRARQRYSQAPPRFILSRRRRGDCRSHGGIDRAWLAAPVCVDIGRHGREEPERHNSIGARGPYVDEGSKPRRATGEGRRGTGRDDVGTGRDD